MPLPDAIDVDLYLDMIGTVVEARAPSSTADIDVLAIAAIGHFADDAATPEDVHNFRAWITHQRLTGMPEKGLVSSLAVAEHMAIKLGIA